MREPFLVLDGDARIKTANASFYRAFRVSAGETEGCSLYDLGDGQWDIPGLRTLLEEAISGAIAIANFEVELDFPAIGPRSMLLNARRFPPGAKTPN